MIITVKTTISFDTIKEQDAIKRFLEDFDIKEWAKNETTLMTTFTTSTTYHQTRGEEE